VKSKGLIAGTEGMAIVPYGEAQFESVADIAYSAAEIIMGLSGKNLPSGRECNLARWSMGAYKLMGNK